MTQTSSYEWPSGKTIKDLANAYSSIYEAKKVDQDQDGDNDFADVRIARMIASGVPKEVAIAKTRNKSYNKEEFELVDEKYMGFKKLEASIAARGGVRDPGAVAASIGRKKYGKKKFQRAAATDHKLGEETSLDEATAMAKRGYDETSIRNKIAKNTGGGEAADRAKELNREAYEAYELVASYLLENNFTSTVEDANVIINNMSEGWFNQIINEKSGEQPLPYSRMMKKSDELASSGNKKNQKRAASIYLAANAPKGPKIKVR